MSTASDNAELHWAEDLGQLLTGHDWGVSGRAILDESFRATLMRRTDELSAGFAELTGRLRTRLRLPPFYVVLRGLTFDAGNVLLAVLASRGGQPVQPYPDPSYQVIRQLRPGASSYTPEWGVLTEWLHTDSTNWQAPHDITMMLCQQPDQNGMGTSLVLPLDDALSALADGLGLDAIERLRSHPLPWAIALEFGGGVTWAPALTDRGIRWQLSRVVEAVQRDSAECPKTLIRFLHDVDRVLRESKRVRKFGLKCNDLLIINNRYALHGRRPIAYAAYSQRVLAHCKVNADGSDGEPELTSWLHPR